MQGNSPSCGVGWFSRNQSKRPVQIKSAVEHSVQTLLSLLVPGNVVIDRRRTACILGPMRPSVPSALARVRCYLARHEDDICRFLLAPARAYLRVSDDDHHESLLLSLVNQYVCRRSFDLGC